MRLDPVKRFAQQYHSSETTVTDSGANVRISEAPFTVTFKGFGDTTSGCPRPQMLAELTKYMAIYDITGLAYINLNMRYELFWTCSRPGKGESENQVRDQNRRFAHAEFPSPFNVGLSLEQPILTDNETGTSAIMQGMRVQMRRN
jgi:hypothetical protein